MESTQPDARPLGHTDRNAYLVHALRFFEDVLAYAERLEAAAGSESVYE